MLFDLGVPKNWREVFPPDLVSQIDGFGWDVQFEEKGVREHLEEAGVQLDEIEAVVWSHTHFDHIGDVSMFPASVDLAVGPGFKKAYTPGYPTNPESPLPESAWTGRQLREISERDFETSGLSVGELQAFDYFGDGSFYLLYTPGHTTEHMSAFVRTTRTEDGEDSFIFLGGDICHHGGEIRPSRYLHLPSEIDSESVFLRSVCPGDLFQSLQKSRGRSTEEPFFSPAMGHNIPQAAESIYKAQEADGKGNVLFLFAHDVAPLKTADLSPKYANDWKNQGWREKMLWSFLDDFEAVVKS